MKLTITNALLIISSIFCFWYAKYSYDKGVIGFRGSNWYLNESPALFWFGEVVVCGFAIYCCYLVFSGESEK